MENELVYIWSGEYGMYWRDSGNGYTTHQDDAGMFRRSDYVHLNGPAYADKKIKLIPVAPEYQI